MIRLRNAKSGVQIHVDDATAATLTADWKPLTAQTAPPPAGSEGSRPTNAKQWRALAAELGVQIPKGAKVAEVKAAVEAHEAAQAPREAEQSDPQDRGDDEGQAPPEGSEVSPQGAIW